MKWFFIHLNWSWLLANIVVVVPLALANASLEVQSLVALLVIFPVSLWVLNLKGRSPAWVFLGFIGAPLWLSNSGGPLQGRGNWFGKHLNWTIVLSWFGASVLTYIAHLMVYVVLALSPEMLNGLDEGSFFLNSLGLTTLVIGLAILLPVWGCVLNKKNKSLLWLPLYVVAGVIGIFLALFVASFLG